MSEAARVHSELVLRAGGFTKKMTALRAGGVQVLDCRGVLVLFQQGLPLAYYHGEVYFPDIKLSAAQVRQINAFVPEAPRTRIDPAQFDFSLAASLIQQLRSFLRRPTQEESDVPRS